MSRKDEIRFRTSAAGKQVMVHGRWLPADERVETNVQLEMRSIYPVQEGFREPQPKKTKKGSK